MERCLLDAVPHLAGRVAGTVLPSAGGWESAVAVEDLEADVVRDVQRKEETVARHSIAATRSDGVVGLVELAQVHVGRLVDWKKKGRAGRTGRPVA